MRLTAGTLSDLILALNEARVELSAPGNPATGTLASANKTLNDLLTWSKVGPTPASANGSLASAVATYNEFAMGFGGIPTNWPPATAPTWPPPETNPTWLSCSDLKTLLLALRDDYAFTQAAPTSAERAAYFNPARCNHGHAVIGRMLISPGGTRYPFAVCTNASHRDALVLWPPYYCGASSGNE